LLEKLYYDAQECKNRQFPDLYEIFLKKYIEVKMPQSTMALPQWTYDRNEFFTDIEDCQEDDPFFMGLLNDLRNKWLPKFKP
jgi:hypothetical protein